MFLIKTSNYSGKSYCMEIPDLSEEVYAEWEQVRYSPNAPLIQHFFPYLSADEREFILNGVPPLEWKEMFGTEEEEDEDEEKD